MTHSELPTGLPPRVRGYRQAINSPSGGAGCILADGGGRSFRTLCALCGSRRVITKDYSEVRSLEIAARAGKLLQYL